MLLTMQAGKLSTVVAGMFLTVTSMHEAGYMCLISPLNL